jgi:uncharacterized membrane protein
LGRYLGSDAARTPLLLVGASAVAAVLALVATRASQRWVPWASGAAAAIALALRAHGGHAAATPTPLLAQAEQWLHLLAGACWAGGLVLLIILVRERREDPPVREAKRFSTIALAAMAIIVASGSLRAVTELGGLDDIVHAWQTSYGRTLAFKAALVLAVIALAAVNRYRSLGKLAEDRRPLLRVATAEIVAVAGILGLSATLTSFAPPVTSVAAAPVASDTVTMTGSDFATTIEATVTVTPATPGPNLYRATIAGYDGGQPVSADGVTLQLASVTRPDLPGATVELHADAGGWVGQALDPSIAGTFRVTAQVKTGASVVEVPLTLITRSAGQITTTPAPGSETAALASFTDGVRIESTSSAANPVQVHVTAYAADGNEMPVADITIVASPAAGPPTRLGVQRFTKGHFASSVDLAAGVWTFDAIATTKDGRTYQCTWEAAVTG